MAFVGQVNDRVANHAPAVVWSYFAGVLADLTIERARRVPGIANPAL